MKRQDIDQSYTKDASGRGAAVICYGLLLGGIMTGITSLIAVVIAALWLPRSADWVRSHLKYQIMTVVWLVVGLLLGTLAWWGFGITGLSPYWAWGFGYFVFTCQLAWLVGRCAVGLQRLTTNRSAKRD